jgi:hypothetical protein
MAKRAVDPIKAKERKQKIIAAVLGVLFLGIMAFQGPKLWKQLHPSGPPAPTVAPTTTTPTTGTPTLVAPTLGGSQTPTPTSGTGSLASNPTPVVADGQLTSFSRFASKDPFAQQLAEKPVEASSRGSSPSGGSSGGASDGGKTSSGGSASDPTPGTAVISLNGALYTVAVGTDFPSASESDPSIVPLFHLISLTAHTAKISIVGGSYASGAPAVTLRENKPVTLMNTADGTKYKLILRPVGTAVPTAAAPPTTSPTSTTVTVPPPSSP